MHWGVSTVGVLKAKPPSCSLSLMELIYVMFLLLFLVVHFESLFAWQGKQELLKNAVELYGITLKFRVLKISLRIVQCFNSYWPDSPLPRYVLR